MAMPNSSILCDRSILDVVLEIEYINYVVDVSDPDVFPRPNLEKSGLERDSFFNCYALRHPVVNRKFVTPRNLLQFLFGRSEAQNE